MAEAQAWQFGPCLQAPPVWLRIVLLLKESQTVRCIFDTMMPADPASTKYVSQSGPILGHQKDTKHQEM